MNGLTHIQKSTVESTQHSSLNTEQRTCTVNVAIAAIVSDRKLNRAEQRDTRRDQPASHWAVLHVGVTYSFLLPCMHISIIPCVSACQMYGPFFFVFVFAL